MKCDQCRCGWVLLAGRDWPEPCGACMGKGRFSWYRLGKILGELPRTVKRVARGTALSVTSARVLGTLLELGYA